ncbi:MAG: hypothetical protein HZC42_15670 [Candidatus Eisenbacteria bacterium]|nr:hypothetical protein [Candidatus Eisenbacteria bacterium]
MRAARIVALVLAPLLVLAGPTRAGGVNFAWDACWSEGGALDKSFLCNTNQGAETAVGSFAPARDHADFLGTDITVDLYSRGTFPLPDWWEFINSGTCRRTALQASFDFAEAPQTACLDPWSRLALWQFSPYLIYNLPPSPPHGDAFLARIHLSAALQNGVPLAAGVEYDGFQLVISNTKTVGSDACEGCCGPLFLVFAQVRVFDQSGDAEYLSAALANQVISWQGGYGNCATPARNRTWGAIKSLYR